MAPGDVNRLRDFTLLDYSLAATADIKKGDIVTLAKGAPFTAGDDGPFGVANQAIKTDADMKGKVLIHGVVSVLADGAIDAQTYVKPASSTKVHTGVTGITELLGETMEAATETGDEIDVEVD